MFREGTRKEVREGGGEGRSYLGVLFCNLCDPRYMYNKQLCEKRQQSEIEYESSTNRYFPTTCENGAFQALGVRKTRLIISD